ncbi:MAG TPA: hypothetical protein VMB47_19710 [Candidatus Aquilonibacter sp.]|nr:hypothetical protein [Candidatus Aquilonibacter sp.]
MASGNTQLETIEARTRPNWGAIWAGTFTFIAIWSVFGSLGLGIFASAASPSANQPVMGMNVGMAAWSILLTIIAMFVAGRTTERLAGITTAREGMFQGMVMFGLSVTAALLIVLIGGNAFGNTAVGAGPHNAYIIDLFTYLGWTLFVALFLGWLGALFGASTAHKTLPARTATVQQQVRHA